MGVVYKARHLDLGKVVALKVLPGGGAGEVHVARFRQEMRAIGRLAHPHIVAAHDAGEADGVHYLAMELVDGADLGRLARAHGRLGVADACAAIRQAALGPATRLRERAGAPRRQAVQPDAGPHRGRPGPRPGAGAGLPGTACRTG